MMLLVSLLPGCLFRGRKDQESRYPTAPILIALLPLNIPPDNPELRETALSTLVLMAQMVERAPDLEAVPLWEIIPVASETLQNSRDITPETAAYLADRMTARWVTQGQLSMSQGELYLILDFLPSRSSTFPFRYEKRFRPESINEHLDKAFKQFVNYLIARPIPDQRGGNLDIKYLNKLALVLDEEYGWFGEANPGKAGETVAELLQSNKSLARFLFNPSLYTGIDGGTEQIH